MAVIAKNNFSQTSFFMELGVYFCLEALRAVFPVFAALDTDLKKIDGFFGDVTDLESGGRRR